MCETVKVVRCKKNNITPGSMSCLHFKNLLPSEKRDENLLTKNSKRGLGRPPSFLHIF